MKKAVVLLVFIALLGTGIYFGLRAQEKQNVIEQCETRQTENNQLLHALDTQDKTICTTLSPPLRERCQAFITHEPALCLSDDLDCIAIAAQNETLCAEPLCRALATQNETHCELLAAMENIDWCKRFVRHEPTPADTTTCQELAELPT